MSNTAESHSHLKAIDAVTSEEHLIEIYRTWSKTYDKIFLLYGISGVDDVIMQDTREDIGYVAPARASEHLAQKLKEFGFPNDACILDLGSGTGLVGEGLHKLGYRNVDGVDISPESLEIAREKAVYRRLTCGYMASENSGNLGIEANQYDAAICIGVFTIGHVKSKGLDDLVHVVKPGGLACFTIRDCVASDPQYGYDEKINKLCMEKKWRLVSKVHEMYHDVNKFRSWLYTYQIL